MKRQIAALLMSAAALSASAQSDGDGQAEQPIGGLGFVDEVEVTVVNVDVYVRDRRGQPVAGLTAADFRVLQDGIEMPISNFAELTQEVIEHTYAVRQPDQSAPEAQIPSAEQIPQIRPVFIVLYIDNENIQPIDRNRIMSKVRSFVVDNLSGPAQMMVVSYQRSLKVLQPFTDNSRAVNDALRSTARMTGGRVEKDNARRDIVRDMQDLASQDYGSDGVDTSHGSQQRMRQRILALAEEEGNDLSFTLNALREVFGMIAGLDGRKSLVYVSSGLPMTPGIGLMHEYAILYHDNSILSQRGRVDKTRWFHSLTQAANGQEVTLYTIDASGLNPLAGFEAESSYASDPTASSIGSKDFQHSLQFMADATGGIAVMNTNDIGDGLALVADDLFSYYSVGYTISSSGRDKVHRIAVELPGHKEYALRYRKRFVEKSRETQVQDRVFSSLMVDVDDNPMRLELKATPPAPAAGTTWTVPVHLSFPLQSVALTREGDEYVGRVVLFVGARDLDGRNSEMQRQEHHVRVPAAEYDTARGQRFGIDARLLLEEGRHRVAVGMMDQVTRQASYDRLVVSVP